MTRDFKKPRNSGINSAYEWELFMVYHHFAKFGDHKYCSSRDIFFLVCHVIKQDHIIKGSDKYNNRRPSR